MEQGKYIIREDGRCIISNGVTEIGIDAFCDCTSIKSITIPGSLSVIGMRHSVNEYRVGYDYKNQRFPIFGKVIGSFFGNKLIFWTESLFKDKMQKVADDLETLS